MTLDGNMTPVPCLAESYEMSEDGLTFTFALRQGIKFHNGKDMTIEDVVASFDYWLAVNSQGMISAELLADHGVVDDTHFFFTTKSPQPTFIGAMANPQGCSQMVVYPKEVVDAALASGQPAECVGTGVYKIAEYVADQYVKLVPNETYVPMSGEQNGWAGEIHAYADELIFKFITENTTKVAGVQTGELDFGGTFDFSQYDLYVNDPAVKMFIGSPTAVIYAIPNSAQYPFTDVRARLAANYAANIEEIATAAIGNPEFWAVEPSIFNSGMGDLYVPNCGEGVYNTYDPEKAKALLAEMEYDGTPVVIVQSKDDAICLNAMTVYAQQLEAAGFVVDLQIYDKPTVNDIRGQKTGWSLHATDFGSSYYDVMVFSSWMATNGWITNWDDEYSHKMDDLYLKLGSEMDRDARKALIADWNNLFYEGLPYIKLFNFSQGYILSPELQDFGYAFPAEKTGNADIRPFQCWLYPQK
ncbi:MAG: ABC transporter substrate-binding protein, partial [Clostridiales bacterium]